MTPLPYERLSRFLEMLDDRCRYVVVKNPDLWGNLQRGGDWDLLVSDMSKARAALLEALGPPRRVAHRSYVIAHFYDWGEIDLLPRVEWKGVELIDWKRLLSRASRNPRGWRIARPAHQALVGWVGPLLSSGSFSEKYRAVVRNAVVSDGAELEVVLRELFGEELSEALWNRALEDRIGQSVAQLHELRQAARRRSFRRRPARTSHRIGQFVYRETKLRLHPALPFVELQSAEHVDSAAQWCAMRRIPVQGLALFDGTEIHRLKPSDVAEGPSVPSRPHHVGKAASRIHLRDRVALSNLQAQGWLAASTIKASGARFSQSALIGRARGGLAAPDLPEVFDGSLERRTERDIGHQAPRVGQ